MRDKFQNTFSLIVARTENNEAIFKKGDQGQRPDNTAGCSDDIFSRWRGGVIRKNPGRSIVNRNGILPGVYIKRTRPDIP